VHWFLKMMPGGPSLTGAIPSLAGAILRYLAAAVVGAAFSRLLMQRHRRRISVQVTDDCAKRAERGPLSEDRNVCANERGPLSRPYDCEVCRLHWRRSVQASADLQAHIASKEHRRNLALLKASEPSSGALSKVDENVHCSFCSVWIRDAASYSVHVSGKKHARNVAAAGGTLQHAFFDRLHAEPSALLCMPPSSSEVRYMPSSSEAVASVAAVSCGVITCDLEKPENAGSICRILSNFSSVGTSLVHVHTPLMADSEATQHLLLRSVVVQRVARHCESKLERRTLSLAEFVKSIPSWPRPIVALETADGAVDLHGFAFPRQCDVLVGGETRGVHPNILSALRPGVDSIVFIPMPGFAKSMNVAAATCAALYEHRRQHTMVVDSMIGAGTHAPAAPTLAAVAA
jgi:tRNA(Leu) C34 or U34 (ribose-2'-O)-methylase TrmL